MREWNRNVDEWRRAYSLVNVRPLRALICTNKATFLSHSETSWNALSWNTKMSVSSLFQNGIPIRLVYNQSTQQIHTYGTQGNIYSKLEIVHIDKPDSNKCRKLHIILGYSATKFQPNIIIIICRKFVLNSFAVRSPSSSCANVCVCWIHFTPHIMLVSWCPLADRNCRHKGALQIMVTATIRPGNQRLVVFRKPFVERGRQQSTSWTHSRCYSRHSTIAHFSAWWTWCVHFWDETFWC